MLKIDAHFSKLFGSTSIEGAYSFGVCPDSASIGCMYTKDKRIEIYYRLEYMIFFTLGSIVYANNKQTS